MPSKCVIVWSNSPKSSDLIGNRNTVPKCISNRGFAYNLTPSILLHVWVSSGGGGVPLEYVTKPWNHNVSWANEVPLPFWQIAISDPHATNTPTIVCHPTGSVQSQEWNPCHQNGVYFYIPLAVFISNKLLQSYKSGITFGIPQLYLELALIALNVIWKDWTREKFT